MTESRCLVNGSTPNDLVNKSATLSSDGTHLRDIVPFATISRMRKSRSGMCRFFHATIIDLANAIVDWLSTSIIVGPVCVCPIRQV